MAKACGLSYDERRMTKKLVALLTLAVAIAVSGRAWPTSAGFGRIVQDVATDRSASAGLQLPAGLLLPVADANLPIASLVTADLDADGDIDVLATENSSGSVKLVVWVNDGDGRLARKAPLQPAKSGFASESSSISDGPSSVLVTIQSGSYAVEPISRTAWISLASQPHRFARSTDPVSASPGTLRSRSPPASLRLS
jgi:hypothetical protein